MMNKPLKSKKNPCDSQTAADQLPAGLGRSAPLPVPLLRGGALRAEGDGAVRVLDLAGALGRNTLKLRFPALSPENKKARL